MPIISVEGDWLNQLLGKQYPIEELAEALEQIGCDVDDVLEVDRFRCPKCGQAVEGSLGAATTNRCTWCEFEQAASFQKIGRSKVIRLDLLAARPDLFDVGGISRALKGYLGQVGGLPEYPVTASDVVVNVDPSVSGTDCQRPFIHCAVIEMPPVNDVVLVSLMKLQEALHWGVGRDRKLASIGVYDLDTIQSPISYTTLDPQRDAFEPLGRPGEPMTGREILEKHPKGIGYARLLADHRRYPALKDAQGVVLSMPPIINSESTKVKLGTTRLFVDVTGISEAAVVKSLDTFVSSMLELGGKARTVRIELDQKTRLEEFEKYVARHSQDDSQSLVDFGLAMEQEFKLAVSDVEYQRCKTVDDFVAILRGKIRKELATLTSPDLSPREMEIDLPAAKKWLGLPLDAAALVKAAQRMRLDAAPAKDSSTRFVVRYPALRTDFKHMVDVFEDLAIGYGYKNIIPTPVSQATIGQPRPEDVQSELVRSVLLGLGFSETMSLPMTTEEAHFEKFRLPVPEHYVRIANPKLKAMTVVRSHLMTGLMEMLRENRRATLPLRLFELDNISVLDVAAETGAREERRLCVVEMGKQSSYATVRSVVDSLLREMKLTGTFSPVDHAAFIPGRVAKLTTNSELTGILGELHPEVLLNFGLDHPVALAELTISNIDHTTSAATR